MTVKVVKGDGGVLASNLSEDGLAAGVGVDEVGYVVDFAVDYEPHRVFGVMLSHLIAGERLGHGGGGYRKVVFFTKEGRIERNFHLKRNEA